MLPEHYHPRNKILSHRTLEPAPRPRRAPCKVMDTTSCNPHPLARNHLTGNRDARTAARYFLPRPRSPKKRRYFASGAVSRRRAETIGRRRAADNARGPASGRPRSEETTPRAWGPDPKAARQLGGVWLSSPASALSLSLSGSPRYRGLRRGAPMPPIRSVVVVAWYLTAFPLGCKLRRAQTNQHVELGCVTTRGNPVLRELGLPDLRIE